MPDSPSEEDKLIPLSISCTICNKVYEVKIKSSQLIKYHKGELIQRVAPDLSADDRELIISRICGNCFDGLFKRQEKENKEIKSLLENNDIQNIYKD